MSIGPVSLWDGIIELNYYILLKKTTYTFWPLLKMFFPKEIILRIGNLGSYKKLVTFDKQLDNATPPQIRLPSADTTFKRWEEDISYSNHKISIKSDYIDINRDMIFLPMSRFQPFLANKPCPFWRDRFQNTFSSNSNFIVHIFFDKEKLLASSCNKWIY